MGQLEPTRERRPRAARPPALDWAGVAALGARLASLSGLDASAGIRAALRALVEATPAGRVSLHTRRGHEFALEQRWPTASAPGAPALPERIASDAARTAWLGPLRRGECSWQGAGALLVPVAVRGELVGILAIEACGARRPWSIERHQLVRVVADQLAQLLERRRLETALHESRELLLRSQRLETLGRLAAGVAHDLNNLLTPIVGYASLLAEDGELADDAREIERAAERASELVEQILGFGRATESRVRCVDLELLVAELAPILRRAVSSRVQLETRLGGGLPALAVDPGRIDQVLLNLAVNAGLAMPEGGQLELATRATRLARALPVDAGAGPALPPGPYAELVVADTGCGMHEDVRRHLFEPFFTTREPGQGTGLGLAVTAAVMEECGGGIRVESAPGEGTRFHLYFPAAPPAPARGAAEIPAHDAAEAAVRTEAGRAATVLLMEPEPLVREVLEGMLTRLGHRVLVAPDSDAALALCRDHAGQIDLLLCDLARPRLRGRELAARARALRPGLCTLFTAGQPAAALRAEGAVGEKAHVLQRPFARPELARALRDALAERDHGGDAPIQHD